MNKRRWKYAAFILGIVIIVILYGVRFNSINKQYPDPEVCKMNAGKELRLGDIMITEQKMKIISGAELTKIATDDYFPTNADGSTIRRDRVKGILVYVQINNLSKADKVIDFTTINIESGAWNNGIDPELFIMLNKGISIQKNILPANTKEEIIIPFSMVDTMVKHKDWKDVGSKNYNVVLALYPKKLMLTGKPDDNKNSGI